MQADHSRRWQWFLALRAADSASRISPLSFDGDKRGRMRQFHDGVAFDQKFLWSDSACPIVAHRISMPRKAAVVHLDDCLPPSLVSAWNHPECEASSTPVAPRHFVVNMSRMEGPLQTHAWEWFGKESSSNVISFSSLCWSILRP